jgi:hypothetical protein
MDRTPSMAVFKPGFSTGGILNYSANLVKIFHIEIKNYLPNDLALTLGHSLTYRYDLHEIRSIFTP